MNDEDNMDDVMHTRCASFLVLGLFLNARRAWTKAYGHYPTHKGISTYVQKLIAYNTPLPLPPPPSSPRTLPDVDAVSSYTTHLTKRRFVTLLTRPVLTPDK